MLSPFITIVLRLIHILFGVFWVGTMVFLAAFVFPMLRAVGPAAGPVVGYLNTVRRLPLMILAAAILTVLSGVTLFWSDFIGLRSDAWMHAGPGLAFSVGGTLGVVALIIGITVSNPTGMRIGRLGAAVRASDATPTPGQSADLQRLQRRLARATTVIAVVLVIAVAAMAVARYIPAFGEAPARTANGAGARLDQLA